MRKILKKTKHIGIININYILRKKTNVKETSARPVKSYYWQEGRNVFPANKARIIVNMCSASTLSLSW